MNIILHIGMPKTGSTAIQTVLNAHREHLLKNNYIVKNKKILPLALGKFGRFFKDIQRDFENTVQLFGNSATYIVSDEGLYNISLYKSLSNFIKNGKENNIDSDKWRYIQKCFIEKLKNIFSNHTVHIIVYVRRQDIYLESVYAQWIRARQMHVNHTNKILKNIFLNSHHERVNLNYNNIKLSIWKEIFVDAKMDVRVYEKGQLVEGDVIADFVHCTGIPLPEESYGTKANVTPSRDALELKLQYNALTTESVFSKPTSEYITKIFRDLTKNCPKDAIFTPAQHIEILEKFQESNRKVAKEFLGREELFYEKWPTLSDEYRKFPALTQEEVTKYFAHALEAMAQEVFALRSQVYCMRQPIQAQSNILLQSGFFDENYYRAIYLCGRKEIFPPAEHYILMGASHGKNPSAYFDTLWYMEQHPEIKETGLNPLLWHLLIGKDKDFPALPQDDTL